MAETATALAPRPFSLGALQSDTTLTMSSREIAALTGKEHRNVMRDVREMLESLGMDVLKFEQMAPDSYGRPQPVFHLPKDLTITLVAGYNVAMRHAIVVRWQELEAKAARPMSQLEMIAASAQVLLEMERRQQALVEAQQQVAADVARIENRVAEVAESRVWDHCPQNCEPITKIRGRMLKEYGLPAWVVDTVMRGLPLSPKVHGMVRNAHEEAKGSHYEVWAVSDVTRVFRRFIAECAPVTEQFAIHGDIDRRFHVKPGVVREKAVAK